MVNALRHWHCSSSSHRKNRARGSKALRPTAAQHRDPVAACGVDLPCPLSRSWPLFPGGDVGAGRVAPPSARSSSSPSPATSTHQVCPPLTFPFCCIKPSTPSPNVSYFSSDLAHTSPFLFCIFTRSIGFTYAHLVCS